MDDGAEILARLTPQEEPGASSWMPGDGYSELPPRERERRYLALFESLPQMSWVSQPDGRVAYFNRQWSEYTGLSARPSREEWLQAFWPEDREVLFAVREPAIARGEPYHAEVRLRRADGVYRWHQCRIVPLRDDRGEIFGWLGTAADVDDIRQAERTLRENEERYRRLAVTADAASRAKDQFLAVLSHELRTPLTPVLTVAQRLEADPRLPRELRGWVEMIRRNVALETRLIDDLLDHTRISRGKVVLHRETVDIHEKIRHTATICESDARGKGLELALDLRAMRRWVRVDPARLQQVLWNLVKNAVKFTPEGGAITIRTADADGGGLEIQVRDTGVGIDPETLPRIFTAFEQGGEEVTRVFGGLGLGLAICKGLVELHGGTLTAGSDGRDRGAVFTIRLPEAVAEPAEGPVRGAGSGLAGDSPGGCRVLLVEDHPDTLLVMSELVEMFGYTVRTADSVGSALQVAAAEPFDVLVSDIGLPDGSGLDLMRQLLARQPRQGMAGIAGIALSGFGMEEDLRRSREAGFLEHLTKPVDLGQLERALARAAAARA